MLATPGVAEVTVTVLDEYLHSSFVHRINRSLLKLDILILELACRPHLLCSFSIIGAAFSNRV